MDDGGLQPQDGNEGPGADEARMFAMLRAFTFKREAHWLLALDSQDAARHASDAGWLVR